MGFLTCNFATISSIIVFPFLLGLSFAQLGSICEYEKGNYTSLFHSNLVAAFSHLTSAASTTVRFHNATVGSGSDKVYALYNCRDDLAASTCQNCVEYARTKLLENSVTKEAIFVHWLCMLRYANRSIVSKMEVAPNGAYVSREIIPDGGVLNRTVQMMLPRLIEEATARMYYFAMQVETYSEYQKVYFLVQCTRDITPGECRECLMDAFNDTRMWASEGRWICFRTGPSCQMRYDLRPFIYFTSLSPAPSPHLLPFGPSPTPAPNKGSRCWRSPLPKLAMTIMASVSILLYF